MVERGEEYWARFGLKLITRDLRVAGGVAFSGQLQANLGKDLPPLSLCIFLSPSLSLSLSSYFSHLLLPYNLYASPVASAGDAKQKGSNRSRRRRRGGRREEGVEVRGVGGGGVDWPQEFNKYKIFTIWMCLSFLSLSLSFFSTLSCTARASRRCIQFSFLSTKPEQVLKLVKLQRGERQMTEGGAAWANMNSGDRRTKHKKKQKKQHRPRQENKQQRQQQEKQRRHAKLVKSRSRWRERPVRGSVKLNEALHSSQSRPKAVLPSLSCQDVAPAQFDRS